MVSSAIGEAPYKTKLQEQVSAFDEISKTESGSTNNEDLIFLIQQALKLIQDRYLQ